MVVISSPKLVPGAHPAQVLYDLTHNPGYVAMGTPAHTTEFAVDAITSMKKQRITASEPLLPTPGSAVKPLEKEILKIVFLFLKEGK